MVKVHLVRENHIVNSLVKIFFFYFLLFPSKNLIIREMPVSQSYGFLSIAKNKTKQKKCRQFSRLYFSHFKSFKKSKHSRIAIFDFQKQYIQIIILPGVMLCEMKFSSSFKYFVLKLSKRFSKQAYLSKAACSVS